MSRDEFAPQPRLTSHELHRVGPQRGKPRYEVSRAPVQGANERRIQVGDRPRPQNFKSRPPRNPPKPQGFDHDVLLQAYKGRELTVYFNEGDSLDATLVDGDKFTLLVEEPTGARQIIFKSSISSIELPKQDA